MSLICLNGTEYPLPRTKSSVLSPGDFVWWDFHGDRAIYLLRPSHHCLEVLGGMTGFYSDNPEPGHLLDFEPRTLDGTDLLRWH